MRYYIRHDKHAKVEGPFTIGVLNEAIRAGRIPSTALASSDLGDDVADLQVWRSSDWFPLAAIGHLRENFAPLPETPSQPRRISLFTVMCCLVAAVNSSYMAITGRDAFWWLLAVLTLLTAVGMIVRYAGRREKSRHAS